MFRRMWRSGALAAATLALLAAAQPALAFQRTGQTGTVGYYHVADSDAYEGGECWYGRGPGSLEHLVKMWVLTPEVRAIAAMGTEKVGWQYTIQRRMQGEGWTNRLTSKIFTAYTDATRYADFGNKSAKVIVPNGPDGPSASYRATIKMLWFAADGRTVIGTVSGLIQTYSAFGQTTGADENYHGSCPDYELQ